MTSAKVILLEPLVKVLRMYFVLCAACSTLGNNLVEIVNAGPYVRVVQILGSKESIEEMKIKLLAIL